jgi:hypothetical protein
VAEHLRLKAPMQLVDRVYFLAEHAAQKVRSGKIFERIALNCLLTGDVVGGGFGCESYLWPPVGQYFILEWARVF